MDNLICSSFPPGLCILPINFSALSWKKVSLARKMAIEIVFWSGKQRFYPSRDLIFENLKNKKWYEKIFCASRSRQNGWFSIFDFVWPRPDLPPHMKVLIIDIMVEYKK